MGSLQNVGLWLHRCVCESYALCLPVSLAVRARVLDYTTSLCFWHTALAVWSCICVWVCACIGLRSNEKFILFPVHSNTVWWIWRYWLLFSTATETRIIAMAHTSNRVILLRWFHFGLLCARAHLLHSLSLTHTGPRSSLSSSCCFCFVSHSHLFTPTCVCAICTDIERTKY